MKITVWDGLILEWRELQFAGAKNGITGEK